MYLIFIPFAQNSSLASWIFNGTINIFNPFKTWHEAGNWIILTKLNPAKQHQAAHQPYPFVHNWEERQHARFCLHVNPPAYQGLEDKINSTNFWVLHTPNAREGTVLEINQVGFVSTILCSFRIALQGVGYQGDLGAQGPGGPDPR